ncbi:MAG: Tol-Pal system beta propeller repeat protein TolB [Candidatus Hydrogenedentes bacterium]|nr:Tol-Pal system beta propeller repeat protein TolB [Candidatus Hydrogenedentota bacterium]
MRILRILLPFLVVGQCMAQVSGTIVGGPNDARIAIAAPPFATVPGKEALGSEMAAVLSNDLEFSGLIRPLTRDLFPAGFAGFTSDATQINFDAWRHTPAQFLVHVYVTSEAGKLAAECRLMDVATGQQVVGKRLASEESWWRLIAHQFADEIVRFLDGEPGIATSRVCYSGGTTGKKEIYVADYDGANETQLTKHGSISILPAFSPDGSKIAYVSYKDRYQFLYIYDLASGKSTALSKEVGMNSAPAWAPDGKRLAMVLSKDANSEIYLVNADGSNKQRLTNNAAVDSSPCFSPDGRQIAFVSERGGNPQIHVMDVTGGNPHRVSFQGGKAYDPAWSPDGKSIAYVVETGGAGFEIYVMNADGSNPRQLTASGGSNESPSWSRDSRHVVFSSTRSGSPELWTANVTTGENRKVASIGVRAQGPDWGPRR